MNQTRQNVMFGTFRFHSQTRIASVQLVKNFAVNISIISFVSVNDDSICIVSILSSKS